MVGGREIEIRERFCGDDKRSGVDDSNKSHKLCLAGRRVVKHLPVLGGIFLLQRINLQMGEWITDMKDYSRVEAFRGRMVSVEERRDGSRIHSVERLHGVVAIPEDERDRVACGRDGNLRLIKHLPRTLSSLPSASGVMLHGSEKSVPSKAT